MCPGPREAARSFISGAHEAIIWGVKPLGVSAEERGGVRGRDAVGVRGHAMETVLQVTSPSGRLSRGLDAGKQQWIARSFVRGGKMRGILKTYRPGGRREEGGIENARDLNGTEGTQPMTSSFGLGRVWFRRGRATSAGRHCCSWHTSFHHALCVQRAGGTPCHQMWLVHRTR